MVFNLIDRQCAFTVMESTLYKCPPTVDVDGGVRKKYGFKGGVRRKILGLKWGGGGGGREKKTFKFCSDGICNNGNSLPDCQIKSASLTFRKFSLLLGKHDPGPPTSLCTKRQLYPSKMQKNIPNRTFHWEKIAIHDKTWKVSCICRWITTTVSSRFIWLLHVVFV